MQAMQQQMGGGGGAVIAHEAEEVSEFLSVDDLQTMGAFVWRFLRRLLLLRESSPRAPLAALSAPLPPSAPPAGINVSDITKLKGAGIHTVGQLVATPSKAILACVLCVPARGSAPPPLPARRAPLAGPPARAQPFAPLAPA
jgi:hypothetical protein